MSQPTPDPSPESPLPDFRWDDLKVALAIHRHGSLRDAAKALRINASTVGRRLDALEEAVGKRLFERRSDGLRATGAGLSLLPAAEGMEAAAHGFWRGAEVMEEQPRGRVRITAPPGLVDRWLAPRMGGLRAAYPQLTVELHASVDYVDLRRHGADIALRGRRPETGDLLARKLGTSPYCIVGAAPVHIDQWRDHEWIAYGDDLGQIREMQWMDRYVPRERIALRAGYGAQAAAVSAGMGIMLMSRFFSEGLAEATLDSARQKELDEIPDGELWLACHRLLRDVPRVAVTWAYLVTLFEETAAYWASK